MDKIEKLSEELYSEIMINSGEYPIWKVHIQPYFKKIQEANILDFMVYNYSNYSRSYLIKLTFYTYDLWKNESIEYWEDLMMKTKGWEGIGTLIELLHKHIKVNALKLYLDIPKSHCYRKKKSSIFLKGQQFFYGMMKRILHA